MENVIILTTQELNEIMNISKQYEVLTRKASLILIEKIKINNTLEKLNLDEAQNNENLKNNIINEQHVTEELIKKYGEFKNINIETGEIMLK